MSESSSNLFIDLSVASAPLTGTIEAEEVVGEGMDGNEEEPAGEDGEETATEDLITPPTPMSFVE